MPPQPGQPCSPWMLCPPGKLCWGLGEGDRNHLGHCWDAEAVGGKESAALGAAGDAGAQQSRESLGQMLGILCPLSGSAPCPACLLWGLACACWVFGALNSGWHL